MGRQVTFHRFVAASLTFCASILVMLSPVNAEDLTTPSPEATPTVEATPTPVPEAPAASPSAVPSASATPTGKPKPSNSPKPSPEETAPTPSPSPTPAGPSPEELARLSELAKKSADAEHDVTVAERKFALITAYRDAVQVEADRQWAKYMSATGAASDAQNLVDDYARSMYMNGPTDLTFINGLLNAQSPTEFADIQVKVRSIGRYQSQELDSALGVLDQAEAENAAIEAVLAAANADAENANAVLSTARADAATAQAEFSEVLSVISEDFNAVQAAQAERNAAVSQGWADYMALLADVKATPLAAVDTIATTLIEARILLPEGYRPVPTDEPEGAEPGVAIWGKGKDKATVLPQETTRAVSQAVGALGAGYLWNAPEDPAVFDCVNLISRSYADTGLDVPNGLVKVARSYPRVPVKSARPGDVVLIANEPDGIHYGGIVVAPGQMIAASSAAGTVTVQDIPSEGVWGAVRPSLGVLDTPNEVPVPQRPEGDEPTMRCDAPPININTAGQGAWGGWANGLIPFSAMCPLADNPGHYFRCDAAKAWEALDRAYRKQFDRPLCLTDSYRAYEVQARIYETGQSQAVPGTSNHGWGLATDLCIYNAAGQKTGIGFDSPDYKWLRENAPKYGWIHPMWARPGMPLAEPWHWQYLINDSVIPYSP